METGWLGAVPPPMSQSSPGAVRPPMSQPPPEKEDLPPLHEPEHLRAVHDVLRKAARRFVEEGDGSASPPPPGPPVEPPNDDDQDEIPLTAIEQRTIEQRCVTRRMQAAQKLPPTCGDAI